MDSLFSRYANALLSIGRDENKVKEYKEALIDISNYLEDNPETHKYLESYLVPLDLRYEVIDVLTKDSDLANLANFLKVLVKKHRFHHFLKITKEYIKLANIELGILEGLLYSASSLTKEEIARVEKTISKRMKKPVELHLRVDSRLIGGIKVVINEHIFDGSIQGKLAQLRSDLSERR